MYPADHAHGGEQYAEYGQHNADGQAGVIKRKGNDKNRKNMAARERFAVFFFLQNRAELQFFVRPRRVKNFSKPAYNRNETAGTKKHRQNRSSRRKNNTKSKIG